MCGVRACAWCGGVRMLPCLQVDCTRYICLLIYGAIIALIKSSDHMMAMSLHGNVWDHSS